MLTSKSLESFKLGAREARTECISLLDVVDVVRCDGSDELLEIRTRSRTHRLRIRRREAWLFEILRRRRFLMGQSDCGPEPPLVVVSGLAGELFRVHARTLPDMRFAWPLAAQGDVRVRLFVSETGQEVLDDHVFSTFASADDQVVRLDLVKIQVAPVVAVAEPSRRGWSLGELGPIVNLAGRIVSTTAGIYPSFLVNSTW